MVGVPLPPEMGRLATGQQSPAVSVVVGVLEPSVRDSRRHTRGRDARGGAATGARGDPLPDKYREVLGPAPERRPPARPATEEERVAALHRRAGGVPVDGVSERRPAGPVLDFDAAVARTLDPTRGRVRAYARPDPRARRVDARPRLALRTIAKRCEKSPSGN